MAKQQPAVPQNVREAWAFAVREEFLRAKEAAHHQVNADENRRGLVLPVLDVPELLPSPGAAWAVLQTTTGVTASDATFQAIKTADDIWSGVDPGTGSVQIQNMPSTINPGSYVFTAAAAGHSLIALYWPENASWGLWVQGECDAAPGPTFDP